MDDRLTMSDTRKRLKESELIDAEERRVIVDDLESNIVVVASAGTGKTESLVRRMVAGVVAGKLDVESIVAITFTRMAAGEMRARFAERLRDQAEENENAREALRRIDRAFVGTIHAFCARILRERPLDVGLRPDFTEVDEHDVTILWRRYWRAELQRLYAEGDPRIDALAEMGVDARALFDFFVTRSEHSDLELAPGLDVEPELSAALEQAQAAAAEAVRLIGGRIPDERDTFLDLVDLADHLVRYRGVQSVADRAELLRIYRRAFRGITLKRWPDRDVARRVKNEIVGGLVELAIDPALTLWRQYVYGVVAPLIDDVVERFARHRRESGLVTFHDLLVVTARLLKESPDARRFFQQKYRNFFVDEFQDTDPLQAEIISYLVGTDTSERDWRLLVPLSGRLFVVGDEKQSIYRFRRADIEVFRLVSDQVVASGGRQVKLRTSFRSEEALCGWINKTFSPLFESQSSAYQAEYDELSSASVDGSDEPAVLRITTEKVKGNDAATIAAQEARRIADYIESVTASAGVDGQAARSPGDFMILTRRKRFLATYAAALEAREIPYDIVGGDSLGTSEELAALVNMLEAIRRPANEVAMLAYLRGPLVGLGDDDLYEYSRAGGRFRSTDEPPDDLPDGVREKIRDAFDVLHRARTDLFAYPVATAFERIVDRIGLAAFAAGKESGSTRVGNLLRAISLVRKWESEGHTWSEAVTELQAVISDKNYQYEQMTLDVGRPDVVRVMNLHQAKGLEADVVILADAYDSHSHSVDRHVKRTGDREQLSMAVSVNRGQAFSETIAEPVGWDAAVEEESHFGEAEELRVTYVAATRAGRQLIVCRYPEVKNRGPWHRIYSKLVDVPELTAEAAIGPRPEPRMLRDPRGRLLESKRRWADLSGATYAVRTVTGADPVADLGETAVVGRGADYGTLVHAILETAINGMLPSDPRTYVEALSESMGLKSLASQALEELERFRDSELWRELMGAREVYSEVPFGHRVDGEPGAVMRGTIDLVMLTDKGWKIVDFKTHLAETDDSIGALREMYAGQLRSYASAWRLLSGQPVVEAGLWLTAPGVFVSLGVNDGE